MNTSRWLAVVVAFAAGCSIGKIGNGLDDASDEIVAGRVVDLETGEALAGVRIQAGDLVTTSELDGTWQLPAAAASRPLVVFRRGYAPQVEPAVPGRGGYLTIGLQPALLTRTLNIVTGGDVAIDADQNGFAELVLRFPPGFIDSEKLTGTSIGLTISHLDVAGNDLVDRFPGAFLLQDSVGQRLFATYGAFNVTFHDGDRLLEQVDLARSVEANVLIPDSGLAEGDRLALSWLDPDTATWRQDGDAIVVVKNGLLAADATVDHFTWWTLAQPIEATGCVTVRLLPDGPVPGALMSSFDLVAIGVDYAGMSSPVAFSTQGVASATGWAGHRIRLIYGYNGAHEGPLAVDLGEVTLPAVGCAQVDTAFSWRSGRIEGFVLDGNGRAVTDTLVVVEESGQLLRPRGDGFFRAEGLAWAPSGTTYHVRALPTTRERFVAQTVVLRQSSLRVDLEPAAEPLPPVVLEAALADARPVTTTGTRFRLVVADERNGLSWSASPTIGTISDVFVDQQDDGSTYTLTIDGVWSAAVTGPAELIIRVSDSDGRSIEHSFRATWRSSD